MNTLDRTVALWLHAVQNKSFFLDEAIVILAQYLPFLIVLLFLVAVFSREHTRDRLIFFLETAAATLLSRGIMVSIIRFFYHRPRPFAFFGFSPLVPDDPFNSFPSGHASFFFALAASVWMWDKRWGAFFFALALVNGVARMSAGLHWGSDILGGAALGILSVLFVRAVSRQRQRG